MKITLKGKTLGKDTTVTFISIRELKTPDNLYTNAPLGKIEIPLQIKDSITTIIFNYNEKSQSVSDTLRVSYRNQTRVISIDCGAYLYQLDLAVPKTNFDKTRVTSSVLLTTVKSNLEIFL
ncbi:MAG: hypothetical protein JJE09_02850 [Bacteroidia bacterium]|nr:hypothetical protein [Bacteroidia bacterium]